MGPWLPEPALTSELVQPDSMVEPAERVTLVFLLLLDALSPKERAVFLLSEVFDSGHAEIATCLNISPANSRHLLHRARRHPRRGRHQVVGDTVASGRTMAQRFAQALAAGDEAALTSLLAPGVAFTSDGGGKAVAAARPLVGRDVVVGLLVGLTRTARRTGQADAVSMSVEDVNQEAAVVVRLANRLDAVFVLTADGEHVTNIRVMRNPDKLARLDRHLTTHSAH